MATTAMRAHAASSSTDVDMVLINDLYEEIENRPPAIEARRLLIQHCLTAGWDDAARDAVQALLRLAPTDYEAKAWAIALNIDETTKITSPLKEQPEDFFPAIHEDTEMAKVELFQGYEKLRLDAKRLRNEVALLRSLASEVRDDSSSTTILSKRLDTHWQNLNKLSSGRVSTVLRVQQLRSTRAVARDMESNPGNAMNIALNDLEDFALWLRSPAQPKTIDDDGLREALVKRVRIIASTLPEALRPEATTAQMHAEHEIVRRTYVNDETMYGDAIPDIPRANFLVTDDGYAWDMEELVQAITSAKGVMRNPLSKQMFTTNDIKSIVNHPLGRGLRALQIEQSKLSKGVRPKTIEEMEKMANVLLADMSEDQLVSRNAVDAFLAYVATLPDGEQKALEELRVPAKDSHTGQGFDCSISEAVLDAKGNRVCFHKTGDFLRQAASHLKQPA